MILDQQVHEEAIEAARLAASNYFKSNGEHPFNCGFSSVIARVKGNTKLGKSFISRGFKKNYGGGYRLWNPSGNSTQDLSVKAAGTAAYIAVINKYMPDVVLYADNRLD